MLFPIMFFVVGPLVGFDHKQLFQGSTPEFIVMGIFAPVELVLLFHFGLLKVARISWADLGWRTDGLPRGIGLGLLVLVGLLLVFLGILTVIGADLGELKQTIAGYTVRQRLLFLCIGLAAAVTEESLFRGYIQPTLIAKRGMVVGILLSALIFSLSHVAVSPNPIGLVMKVFLGVIYGIARGRDRSLTAAVVGHFLFWQVIGAA